MFNNNINYKSIAYSVVKHFLNKDSVEFYLYWENKISNIDVSELSLIDKIFVIMCQEQKLGMTWFELKNEYQVDINKDNVYDILLNYQCSDIEITVMAKSFLYYQFSGTSVLEEQIHYIMKNGKIDLPHKLTNQ